MKTSFRFAAAALAALAALACSKVETADPDNTPSPDTSGKTPFTLTAAIDTPAPASRVAMEDDGTTAIDLKWTAGDQIYVINGNGTSETIYTFTVANISADGKTASFTCPDYPDDATPAYAIHQGTRSFSAFNPASIGLNTSYALSASAAALASNFTLYAKYDPVGKRLLFKPFMAVLKLNVTLPEAVSGTLTNIRIGSGENSKIFFNNDSYNITGEQPEHTSSIMTASKQFSGSASISGGSATVYLQMHPGTELAGHPLDITLVAGSYAYTASVTGGALETGKCYPLTLPAARWTVGGKIYEGGAGTQDDPYLLKTATNLQALSHATRADWNTYRYFRLENDIADIATTSSDPWLPIGTGEYSFNGHFNGNGKTIRGTFHLSDKDGTSLGLFGSAYSSDISDLTLDGEVIYRGTATLSTPLNIGAIAGQSGALTNCKHIGSLTAENTATSRGLYVGGIVGYCDKNITGCTQQGGTITGNAPQSNVTAGGICGSFDSSSTQMHTCRSESDITVTSSSSKYIGALVGDNLGTVYSCSTFLASITITVNGEQQSPLKAIGYGNALDTSEHLD